MRDGYAPSNVGSTDYKEIVLSAYVCLGYPEVRKIFLCASGNQFGSLEDLWAPSSMKQLCHNSQKPDEKIEFKFPPSSTFRRLIY